MSADFTGLAEAAIEADGISAWFRTDLEPLPRQAAIDALSQAMAETGIDPGTDPHSWIPPDGLADLAETIAYRNLVWNGVVDDDVHGLSPAQLVEVEALARDIHTWSDDRFILRVSSLILNAAIMTHHRGRHNDDALTTIAFNEASRRDPRDDTTDPTHPGAHLYGLAHDMAMRSQGHTPMSERVSGP